MITTGKFLRILMLVMVIGMITSCNQTNFVESSEGHTHQYTPVRMHNIRQLVIANDAKTFLELESAAYTPNDIVKESLDVGDAAIPLLEQALDDKKTLDRHWIALKRDIAGECLALIGGDKAKKTLKTSFENTKDNHLKRYLCASMASTGSPEDIDYLIKALSSPEWAISECSAYSIGVLDARKALGPLNKLAEKERSFCTSTYASFAASEAVKWMNRKPHTVYVPFHSSEEGKVISAIFESGIPRIDQGCNFYDSIHHGSWRVKDGILQGFDRLKDGVEGQNPYLSFRTHRNRNDSRAVVYVNIRIGRLNGNGFIFSLRKVKGTWKVTGLIPTWVS